MIEMKPFEIRPSSFKISDGFGLLLEVKPIVEKDVEIANKEISNFFKNYRIMAAFKESNMVEKQKEVEYVQPLKTIGQRQPRPAKFLPMNRLVWFLKNIKSPFGMQDFIDCKAEDFDKYSFDEKKEMWRSVIAHSRKYKLVEVTTPDGTERRSYKYRYIGVENIENNKLNSLKEGNKVILGTIR